MFCIHKILYHPTSAAYSEGKVHAFHTGPSKNAGINPAKPLVVRLGIATWTLLGLFHFLHLEHAFKENSSDSLFHAREAELGVALVRSLIDRDILIISPCRARVALVKKIWEQRNPQANVNPRVQAVDGSQGSEANAVIVLITRNYGSTSFLESTKQTNMMRYRACVTQYVIGNWDVVSDDGKHTAHFWRSAQQKF
ncbi:hypothetical protein BDV26DRAFT_197474 [Aspergillus bertholletiae]|uniref:DNA2/NAM7 helicase-like C-terminal domain-containing protein n=1 Tax=Aspergillus bertholletiae TaxID=1226010 RepID=A0A5N7B8Q7_9EURO|nr:hypothetical protein BDV26DRAFT_197474 [Aspergillus bertholletiae]